MKPYPFHPLRPFELLRFPVGGTVTAAAVRKALFDNGEEGALYLPGPDTCFTDIAGTTLAGPGDTVAYIADSNGNRYPATEATEADRPRLGRTVAGGRRNEIYDTAAFQADWFMSGVSISANQPDPFGGNEAVSVKELNNISSRQFYSQGLSNGNNLGGLSCVWSGYLKYGGREYVRIASRALARFANFNLLTGETSFATNCTATSIAIGGGWFRCAIFAVSNRSAGDHDLINFISLTSNTNVGPTSGQGDPALGFYLYGPQLEQDTTLTPYQRIGTTALDVTEAGKPDKWYLEGIDKNLSATFPSTLTGATIVRGDATGVGTILNQEIVSPYNLMSLSRIYSKAIVDRELVGDELADLQAFTLNRTDRTTAKVSGGFIVQQDGYIAHIFTASDDLIVNEETEFEYLVVAGGGASEARLGPSGGGGAGEVVPSAVPLVVAPGVYAITIGAGGTGGAAQDEHTDGNPSVIDFPVPVEARAGKRSIPEAGGFSPSSGGAAGNTNAGGSGFGLTINGVSDAATRAGGGGGGEAEAGESAYVLGEAPNQTGHAGDGGDGIESSITGESKYYGGGGGGGTSQYPSVGLGGLGGGGNGGLIDGNGTEGQPNTGGGAGGGGRNVTVGQPGGSGIVVLRYPDGPAMLGGTVTEADGWEIHTFTESDTLTVIRPSDVEYLVVAGGGGGGYIGGGGGAGGYRTNVSGAALTLAANTYVVTVGGGGTGSTVSGTDGGKGTDSSIAALIVSEGGGGGGSINRNGVAGGSGGGGGVTNTSTKTGGAGTVGQGNDGGTATYTTDVTAGSGGGGAGEAGSSVPGDTNAGGDGGDGLPSSITGDAVFYAGGGGGGTHLGSLNGTGGSGGGGGGASRDLEVPAQPGEANTGGGGGGGATSFVQNGATGGSGIVILRTRS